MQLKDYLIVLVIMGLVMWCISGSVYLLNSEYNTDTVNISVIDSMGGDLDELNSKVNSTYNTVASPDSVSAGDAVVAVFSGIGNFFLSIFNIVAMPFKWISTIGSSFGIPSVVTIALVTLLLIGITFAVVKAILQKTP